jgi:hypothetical protein
VCAYLWDAMYLSRVLPLMADRDAIRAMLMQYVAMRPEDHFAFEPFTGQGFGPCYALNAYSLARLFRDYVAYHQDWSVFAPAVGGQSLLDRLEQLSRIGARSPHEPLLDYGDTTHLLEMRTAGYEHVVPSPNAERIWILRLLADVRDHLRLAGAEALRAEASAIQSALVSHLWDAGEGWFRCLDSRGRPATVFSVQILTLLGLELLAPEMAARVASHVCEGEFLGSHGLHSVSLADRLHYESGDVDWGGGGTYVGQPSLLIGDLYRMGEWQRAEEVLRRLMWWAEIFPYFPQSIRADRAGYCDFDRPNCIAAIAGVQAITAGLCGIDAQLDGRLAVRPWPLTTGSYSLRGFRWGGESIDLEIDGKRYRVLRDGKTAASGSCGEVTYLAR